MGNGGDELDEVAGVEGGREDASHSTSAQKILTISLTGSEKKLSIAGSVLRAFDRTFWQCWSHSSAVSLLRFSTCSSVSSKGNTESGEVSIDTSSVVSEVGVVLSAVSAVTVTVDEDGVAGAS